MTRTTEPAAGAQCATVGSRVTIRDATGEDWYILTEPEDSDPRRRLISKESPMGRALLGRHPGTQVRVVVPTGTLTVTLLSVEPGDSL